MSTSCLDIVLNLVVLVSYLTEDAIRLRTHLFSQLYVAELRAEKNEEKMSLPTAHQPFVFQSLRCCLRYHVLLQLLEGFFRKSKVSMIEIGVHTASTATFLLNRLSSLQWTGVDPYNGYGNVSGDQFYSDAMMKLKAFEGRARLLRMPSSAAYETTGPFEGLDESSFDVLFVDGDHDYNATLEDLRAWSRFVRPGGIVAGHDIFNPVNDAVTLAVEDFLKDKNQVVNFATDHTYWWMK